MTLERIETGELPGNVLDDRYEIRSVVGKGGMAVVFRAWDTELHREVAVKVLRSDPDEPGDAQRRRREARALASINHPALVTLFDAIIRDDRSYLVMELVDGDTLRDRIHAGSLNSRDVTAIACDLADGLHAVHERGIIHRDIKPANILLAPSPHSDRPFRVKLSDFGIAHLNGATRVTAPGLLLGTALYISPEQASGRELAPSSDIYALGLTLLEAHTGTPAFTGSPLEVVTARMSRDPEIPASLGHDWVALLAQMTQREPEKRPTALEVCRTVRRIRDDENRAREAAPDSPTEVFGLPAASSPDAATERLGTRHVRNAAPASETRILPVADREPDADGVTALLGAGAPAAPRPGQPSGREARTVTTTRSSLSRRNLVIAGVIAVLALVGLVTAFSLAGSAPADETTPPPALPSLPAPLDSDMQNLMDQVQP